jgi:hypothetical protein
MRQKPQLPNKVIFFPSAFKAQTEIKKELDVVVNAETCQNMPIPLPHEREGSSPPSM